MITVNSAAANSLKKVVGRQRELNLFGANLDKLLMSDPITPPRNLHFYGTAGVGKTTLLNEFRTLSRRRSVVHTYVSYEEARMRLEVKDPYAETLYVFCAQLADQEVQEMQQLLSDRAALNNRWLTSESAEEKTSARQALDGFVGRFRQGLLDVAAKQAVVFFFDGLEDAIESAREKLESDLLIPLAESPKAMVVSASRASLEETWRKPRLTRKFEEFHMQPLSSAEVDQLLEVIPGGIPGADLLRSSRLKEYGKEIGRGHPAVTAATFTFLSKLLVDHRELALVERLDSTQERDLLEYLEDQYLKRFALRDLDKQPWAAYLYREIVPARRFTLSLLSHFLTAFHVEQKNPPEPLKSAVDWLQERGLAYWTRAGYYELDPVPRDLMIRLMGYRDPSKLLARTQAAAELCQAQVFSAVDVPNRPLATVDYLYYLCRRKQLEGVNQNRIEIDILEELSRCLQKNIELQDVDALLSYMKHDDELDGAFGSTLAFKAQTRVERFAPRDAALPSSSRVDEHDILVREVLNENCILFVGPGLTLGPDYLDEYSVLATRLAEQCGYCDTTDKLEDVAQYYLSKLGSDSLRNAVAKFQEERSRPDEASFDKVVSLPFRVIVTTDLGRSVEEAYRRAKWSAEIVHSLDAKPDVDLAEDLVIKLCGTIDVPDSLIITRRDHLQLRMLLAQPDNLLASTIGTRTPLFIGFDPEDPLLYALHMLACGATRSQVGKSFIALEKPAPYLGEAWRDELAIIGGDCQNLLRELEDSWQDWLGEKMRIWSGEKIVEDVKAGASLAGRRMSGMVLEWGTSLEGQDLRSSYLNSARLDGVLLNDARLDGAELISITLEDAQLDRVTAEGANFIYAKANRAKLNNAQFINSRFTYAALAGAEVARAEFTGSDLIWANLSGVHGDHAVFSRANLSKTLLADAVLPGAIFRDALMWNADLKHAQLQHADFAVANLVKAQLQEALLVGASFYAANLTDADFTGADVRDVDFTGALLKGCDLRRAHNLQAASLAAAKWEEALLPEEVRKELGQRESLPSRQSRSGRSELVELAREVLRKNCILFVGPGLTLGPRYMEIYAKITASLAQESGYDSRAIGLSDVAQYYASQRTPDQLARKFMEMIRESHQPDRIALEAIASLPFDVIMTTSVDSDLEDIYRRARRRCTRLPAVAVPRVPVQDEVLIVHLYGSKDGQSDRMVLTRRDRLERENKLAQSNSILAPFLGARVPIFIGFSLGDPSLYRLHSLVNRLTAPLAGHSFVAIDDSQSRVAEAWNSEGLVTLDRSSQELLLELQQRWLRERSKEWQIWEADDVLAAMRAQQPISNRRMIGIAFPDGTHLQGQDLRGCTITSGELNGVLLNDALLDGSDLNGIQLEHAQLEGGSLRGATMVYAKANRASFAGADLGKAVLVYAALQYADLAKARLAEADLTYADLQGVEGPGADFTRAILANALFAEAELPGASFRSSFAARARFRNANLASADFQSASLADAKFEGANVTNVTFHTANLSGADFTGADVRGAVFHQARLDGADFHDAKNVMEADFTGSRWQSARLSDELREKLEAVAQSRTAGDLRPVQTLPAGHS